MNDNGDYKKQLSEFAKLIAEGKKEKLENDKKVVAETKKRFAAKYDLSEKVLDSAGFIDELFGTSSKKVEPVIEEPVTLLPEPTHIIEDVVEPTEMVVDEPKMVVDEPISQETIITKAVKSITKVAENTNLMSTTPVDKVDPNFKAVQDKLKYLEQWISKISTTGPGSGSYWLNDLGDTDKTSLYSATEGQVLTYSESTRKWYAADPTGSGGGPTLDSFARLQANTAFDEANTAVQLALAAYDYANTIVSDTLVDPTARADILVVASYANAAFIKANTISEYAIDNTARTLAQNAYDFANTITIPSVDTSAGVYANGAFIKANSATTLAQQAYDYANTIVSDTQVDPFARLNSNNAYLQANTPSYTANSAALYANGAFDRANASLNMSTNSQLQITDVKNWSNSASSYANSAFIQANASFIRANTPDAIANSAALYANGAFTKANSGVTLAQQAYDYANTISFTTDPSAGVYANGAFIKANSAATLAQQVYDFANTITNSSSNVSTTATASFTTANASFTVANASFTQANTPSYVANSAALYANGAFTKANSAYTLSQQAYDYANTINAGTLTGTTLNSTVVSSSLTSVGTLTGLNVNSSTGGNFFTVAAGSRPGSGTQTWNFWTNTNIGGPASWIEFPDGTHQTTAFVGTAIDQTPRDTANAAFTQANAAFLVANTPSYTANSGALYANAAFIQANAAFIKANTPDAIANSGALYANSAYIQANIAFNTANGAIANTGGSITGRMNIAYTPPTVTGTALTITAANTIGGTGYADFLKVTNTSTGATNGSKTFRLDSSGTVQILNSAYTSVLMQITDVGGMALGGAASTNNDPTTNWLSFNNNGLAIYDDGNPHIHARANGASMWLNTNNGAIILGNQGVFSGAAPASAILMGSSTTVKAYCSIYGSKSYAISNYGYLASSGSGQIPGGSGTVPYSLYCDNRIQASEIDATSDERAKDIQGKIPLEQAVKFVRNIDGIHYTWNKDAVEHDDTGLKAGFGAQEVHKAGFGHMIGIIPNEKMKEQVDEDGWVHPEGMQLTMGYNQAIPYHHEVIKNLLDRIEKLESELSELKKK